MRVLTAAVALTITLAASPQAAHASWSRPQPLDAPGWTAADQADVAVDRSGRALMAWSGWPEDPSAPSALRVRRIGASGRLGAVRTLSDASSFDPGHISVALDDDGDALLAWASYDHASESWQVWTRRLSREGRPGPLVRLSTPGVASWLPRAALTPRGRGAVVFDEVSRGQQVLHTVSRSSQVGEARYLPQGGGGRLVATRDGDFVIAGTDGDGDVAAVRLLSDGRVRSRKVSPASTKMTNAVTDLGVDRRGSAYLTYRSAEYFGPTALWTRTWSRAGKLGPVRRIAPRAHAVDRATSSTDLEGDTVIAWSDGSAYPPMALYSRILRRDGSLGPVQELGPIEGPEPYNDAPSPAPGVALDDDGDGFVVWPAEPEPDHLVTWARRIRPDGSVGAKVKLKDDDAFPHAVAITPDGEARVGLTTDGRVVLVTRPSSPGRR